MEECFVFIFNLSIIINNCTYEQGPRDKANNHNFDIHGNYPHKNAKDEAGHPKKYFYNKARAMHKENRQLV